jgi:hypothetical protein
LTNRSVATWLKLSIGLAVSSAIVLGSESGRGNARSREQAWREHWLGTQNVRSLLTSDRVQAFAVRPWRVGHPDRGYEGLPLPSLPSGTPTEIGGFPVYAASQPLGADLARELVTTLLDENSYFHDRVSGCKFRPGVAFRLWSQAHFLDVLLCFRCDQTSIGPLRGRTASDRWTIGESAPGRTKLVHLAKKALPSVSEVEQVPETPPERNERYYPGR